MKKTGSIIGAILTIASLIGVAFAVDSHFAKAEELSYVSDRLEHKIISDRITDIDERLWKIESRWQDQFQKENNRFPNGIDELLQYMNEDAREYYKKLKKERDELDLQLKMLISKKS